MNRNGIQLASKRCARIFPTHTQSPLKHCKFDWIYSTSYHFSSNCFFFLNIFREACRCCCLSRLYIRPNAYRALSKLFSRPVDYVNSATSPIHYIYLLLLCREAHSSSTSLSSSLLSHHFNQFAFILLAEFDFSLFCVLPRINRQDNNKTIIVIERIEIMRWKPNRRINASHGH